MKASDIHAGHTYAGKGGVARTVIDMEPASLRHRANFREVNSRRKVTFTALGGAVQKTVTLYSFANWAVCDVTTDGEQV